MRHEGSIGTRLAAPPAGGVAGWLLDKLRARRRPEPRLELLKRITLAPRQSLALVEAEGRRFLVATSAEGGPAFYALDRNARGVPHGSQRVSW
jgi:hypothetical protein